MREPISRANWEAKTIEMADGAFALHELKSHSLRAWYVARPQTIIYSFEVAYLHRGRVLVHGDLCPVLFAPSALMVERATIAHLAKSDLDYVSGKVITGSRWMWLGEVAVWDIDAHCERETSASVRRALAKVRKGIGEMCERDFQRELSEISCNDWCFGRVVHPDIIWAWRGLVKLDQVWKD
jgi:hypothetical protein